MSMFIFFRCAYEFEGGAVVSVVASHFWVQGSSLQHGPMCVKFGVTSVCECYWLPHPG